MYKYAALAVALAVSFFAGTQYPDLLNNTPQEHELALSEKNSMGDGTCKNREQSLLNKNQKLLAALEYERRRQSGDRLNAETHKTTPLVHDSKRRIRTLNDLDIYLPNMTTDNFKREIFADLVALTNSSDEAFERIKNEFVLESDPSRIVLLAKIIADSSRQEKMDFASDLVHSDDAKKRRYAYSWLSNAPSKNYQIAKTLIDASYFEEDTDILSELVTTISETESQGDPRVTQATIQRLSELANHRDALVSSRALEQVTSMVQNVATMDLIRNNLNNPSEEVRLAALSGLQYFPRLDQDVLNHVEQLAQDPNSSEQVRDLAKDIVTTYNAINSRCVIIAREHHRGQPYISQS